ncbi:MAG TPA: GyrI-like domain-containing protein, partial [Stellaceae bacterium]
IVDVPATPVAVLQHRGDPALVGDTIRRFIAWRKQAGLPPAVSATFNILHSDPETAAPEECRLDLCAATGERAVPPNDAGVVAGLIPAGRCAVLRVSGSSDELRPAVSFLYADWLPRSGEEPRDFPIYVQRVSFFPDVPENEAVTDVFLPLR